MRETLGGLQLGSRNTITHENNLVHILIDYKDKVGFYLFTEHEYPTRIAY